MRREETLAGLRPYIDRARAFSGWNFEDLEIDAVDPPPPWDYVALAREYAANAERVIDLGTGGGEVYERIVADLPPRFVATEEWHVNAPVARDRLQPLGVDVTRSSSEGGDVARGDPPRNVMPFRDESFDLVLSRHEGIVPGEVARVLRPGGVFLTQQVADGQWEELRAFFPRMTVWPDHFATYRRDFESLGVAVDGELYRWRVAYRSLGDLVYTLLVCSWEIPGFDPEADIDALLALEDAHRDERGLVLTLSRYLMTAGKPLSDA